MSSVIATCNWRWKAITTNRATDSTMLRVVRSNDAPGEDSGKEWRSNAI